jgi:hypothetical protein
MKVNAKTNDMPHSLPDPSDTETCMCAAPEAFPYSAMQNG